MNVDIRKVGIWMLGVGCVAASVGLVGDAVRHANDPTLSSREGIFDLSGWPHALFFGGVCFELLFPAQLLFSVSQFFLVFSKILLHSPGSVPLDLH